MYGHKIVLINCFTCMVLQILSLGERSEPHTGVQSSLRVIWSAVAVSRYKLGYAKRGSTAFKVQKDGCGVPSAAWALLGP